MHIANPIYDVVFKYLMEDKESAILLLSEITQENIVELDLLPQEGIVELEERSLTVYRLDFSAKIKLDGGGFKQVIMEIQKAKLSSDIMRFRRYLGEQYGNKDNYYLSQKNNEEVKIALPLLSIYFLGHELEKISLPVIKVKRSYYDAVSGSKIECREEFIESLTHDSFIIQIPYLKQPYKSELEKLLSIFDQARSSSDKHLLDFKEEEYPKKYRALARRLERAVADQKVRKTMDIEDEILEDLQQLERTIEEKEKEIQKEKKEKEREKREKEREKREKERAVKREEEVVKREEEAVKREKEAVKREEKMAALLKQAGIDPDKF